MSEWEDLVCLNVGEKVEIKVGLGKARFQVKKPFSILSRYPTKIEVVTPLWNEERSAFVGVNVSTLTLKELEEQGFIEWVSE